MQILPAIDRSLVLSELCQGWKGLGEIQETRFLARLRLEGPIVSVFPDGRALIQGVEGEEQARSIYARYVGC